MNLDFSPEDNAFRQEVRTFIAENYPKALREKQERGETLGKEDYLSWHRILAQKGWAVPSWPVELGGTGWTRRNTASPKRSSSPSRKQVLFAVQTRPGRPHCTAGVAEPSRVLPAS